jgi:hypothetical protein
MLERYNLPSLGQSLIKEGGGGNTKVLIGKEGEKMTKL